MYSIKDEIAKNILFYRKKNKLTQKELAEKLGVKHNTISCWEKGTNDIDIATLFNMAQIFNVSITDMYGRDAIESTKTRLTRFNIVNALLNEIGYNLGLTDDSNQYRLYAVDSSLSDVDVILTMEEFDELMNTATDILGYTVDKIIKSKSK